MVIADRNITEDIDKGAERIKKALKDIDRQFVTVGVHEEGLKYKGDVGITDEGTTDFTGPSVVDVAFWNEFGTETSPERPFMRSAIDSNIRQINRRQEIIFGDIIVGTKTVAKGLSSLGATIRFMIQKRIQTASSWAVPNAPSTARKKRRTGFRGAAPLQETLVLLRAITSRVNGRRVTGRQIEPRLPE